MIGNGKIELKIWKRWNKEELEKKKRISGEKKGKKISFSRKEASVIPFCYHFENFRSKNVIFNCLFAQNNSANIFFLCFIVFFNHIVFHLFVLFFFFFVFVSGLELRILSCHLNYSYFPVLHGRFFMILGSFLRLEAYYGAVILFK